MKATYLFLLIALACASSQSTTAAAPAPPPDPRPWSILGASFRLAAVERPQNAAQRYGPQSVTAADSAGVSRWLFEDKLVRIIWLVDENSTAFILTNKSEFSIRIVWDQAAFVDFAGSSHPVMHVGTRYSECSGTKTPSVVVRSASIQDVFIGCNRVRYSLRDWRTDPLMQFDYAAPTTVDSVEQAVRASYEGKRISALLPLQIEGVVNDYLFTFELDRITRAPCRPSRLIEGKPIFCTRL